MARELNGEVPGLVFVGKWGRDVAALRNHLMESDSPGDWLQIFNGISDTELEYLYRHCLFTVFASFAEGWGLPVGESLAYGKPCVASNTTSIPEVGGPLVRYINPYDLQAGYEVIKKLITDRGDLAEWTEQVRSQFRPKKWDSFCSEFFDAVVGFCRDDRAESFPNNCVLPSGEILFAGDDEVARLDRMGSKLVTFRMARAEGWHPVDTWGVWASQRRARLRFRTDLRKNDEVKLYVGLKVPAGSHGFRCTIRAGAGEAVLHDLTARLNFYQAAGRILAQGVLEVDLTFSGTFGDVGKSSDGRSLYGGIAALGFCKADDALARIDLLERVTLFQNMRANLDIDQMPKAPSPASVTEVRKQAP